MRKYIIAFAICSLLVVGGCNPLNTIALPVDEQILWGVSPAGNISEPTPELVVVTFPDANLEVSIREATGKGEGDIHTVDLEELRELNAIDGSITDLSGIEYCKNLEVVKLSLNPDIKDLSPLSELYGREITPVDEDGTVLASYTTLRIKLIGCQLEDISDLVNLTAPDELYLHLGDNVISDLSPLAGLTNLIGLYLRCNEIDDLSPLTGLVSLNNLELWGNRITDVSPLSALTRLTWLELEQNLIVDVSPLASLINLAVLNIRHNSITDISPLASLSESVVILTEGNPL